MLESKILTLINNTLEKEEVNLFEYLRNKLANFYLWVFAITAFIPLSISLYGYFSLGWLPIFNLHIALFILLLIVVSIRNRLTSSYKAFFLIGSFYLIGITDFIQFGLLGEGALIFTLSITLSALLLKMHYVKYIAVLTILTIMVMHQLYPIGYMHSGIDADSYLQSNTMWSSLISTYTFFMITALSGISMIMFVTYELLTRLRKQTKELHEANQTLELLATTDSLTKVLNRLGIDNSFNDTLELFQRYNNTFGIIMLDIDYFKKVNDTYGHSVGDIVLKEVADILKTYTRNTEKVGRWGGEEFIIICPQTDMNGVNKLAETLRCEIEKYEFTNIGKMTASLGLSVVQKNDTQDSLIKRADKALYKAKESGRNMVCVNND